MKQAEENRIRKEDDIRLKREEESKKEEEKMRKKEEEKARREAILQQFKLKKEMENNDDVRIHCTCFGRCLRITIPPLLLRIVFVK